MRIPASATVSGGTKAPRPVSAERQLKMVSEARTRQGKTLGMRCDFNVARTPAAFTEPLHPLDMAAVPGAPGACLNSCNERSGENNDMKRILSSLIVSILVLSS